MLHHHTGNACETYFKQTDDIKRDAMDHRSTENLFAVVSPGLETVCAEELTALGLPPQEVTAGGVAFAGKLRDVYLANLWLRTASRVLVRFAEFRSRDFPDLYQRAHRLPWGRFIRPEASISFRVTCHSSRLNHTTRIAETLESASTQALGRSTNPVGKNPQMVMVRVVDDQVVISIDSSGELLHRRGYRQAVTVAPLRETLAAGVLMLLGWDVNKPLSDPMCGSGSFLLEGALLARQQAPGLNRSFAFMNWPGFRQGLWDLLSGEAQRAAVEPLLAIGGSDENPKAVAAAKENCQSSGVADQIVIKQLALSEQSVHGGQGLVVCNPPYGKRLDLGENPERYYAVLGRELRRAYPGWQIAMVCPNPAFVKATGLDFKQIANLDNGGIKVGLFTTETAK
jgi:putative N6-adenine-specific DNA methylase